MPSPCHNVDDLLAPLALLSRRVETIQEDSDRAAQAVEVRPVEPVSRLSPQRCWAAAPLLRREVRERPRQLGRWVDGYDEGSIAA